MCQMRCIISGFIVILGFCHVPKFVDTVNIVSIVSQEPQSELDVIHYLRHMMSACVLVFFNLGRIKVKKAINRRVKMYKNMGENFCPWHK